jgi:hypothetical protein
VDEVDEQGDFDASVEVMTVADPSAVGLTAEEDLDSYTSLGLRSAINIENVGRSEDANIDLKQVLV